MSLLLVYAGLVIVGDIIAFGIGRIVEHWSNNVGLLVFLGCFMAVFVIAWGIAVHITEPKKTIVPQV
jgi:hypothetical protein